MSLSQHDQDVSSRTQIGRDASIGRQGRENGHDVSTSCHIASCHKLCDILMMQQMVYILVNIIV